MEYNTLKYQRVLPENSLRL